MTDRIKRDGVTVESPGRINIIGEHTDYNDGFVLPAAVNKKIVFVLKRNGTDSTVNVKASNLGESFSFDLKSFSPLKSGWQNYVMGVVDEFLKLDLPVTGFDGEFEGDIPIGSGLSSSAALECSLAYGLNILFGFGLTKMEMARIAQKAEHNFVGVKCGIMDQVASMMGKKDYAIILDCRSMEYEYSPVDLGKYSLLLLNTNVSHALADSEYNTRREECEEAVRALQKTDPGIKSLRDVSIESLENAESLMLKKIYQRCQHVIMENQRVLEAAKALTENNLVLLGKLMYKSHFSLQYDYDVSCPELDYLVHLTFDEPYILGSRMMGGGFGGCTINIIETSLKDEFLEIASRRYRNQFGIDITPITVSLENGASIQK